MDITRITAAEYAAARDVLLARIAAGLEDDQRFVAAWLAGSYGRGEQDNYSDLDVFAITRDGCSDALCARSAPTSGGSVPVRLALFSRFGECVNIHENHHNAPEGGTFSAVMYRIPPLVVDWTILPFAIARRPACTRLLFDRAGIPAAASPEPTPLSSEGRQEKIAERTAFFWMMAAVTAKYIQRGRSVVVNELLGFIESELRPLEAVLGENLCAPTRLLYADSEAQKARLRELMATVARVGDSGAAVVVEAILDLR